MIICKGCYDEYDFWENTIGNGETVCPHCKHGDWDDWEEGEFEDEDNNE